MKKLYIILGFVVLLLMSFLGITYSYEYNNNSLLKFELVGESEISINLGDTYVEKGIKVYDGVSDISDLVLIDSSMLDTNKVGKYKIKYEVNFAGIREYIYRTINVIDNEPPVIRLFGGEVIYVKLGEDYIEPGYEVIDNGIIGLNSDVVIENNINIYELGEYEIKYIIVDNSGNEAFAIRRIIVY